jgi:hypothetical protein
LLIAASMLKPLIDTIGAYCECDDGWRRKLEGGTGNARQGHRATDASLLDQFLMANCFGAVPAAVRYSEGAATLLAGRGENAGWPPTGML